MSRFECRHNNKNADRSDIQVIHIHV